MTDLYFSERTQRYYFTYKSQLCHTCYKPIEQFIWIREDWKKNLRSCDTQYFCKNCRTNFEDREKITLFKLAIVTDKINIPKGSIPIYTVAPSLKNGSYEDTQNIINRDSDETIDNTKFSNSPMLFPGMQIGTKTHLIDNRSLKATMENINDLKKEVLIEFDNGIREAEQRGNDVRATLKLYKFSNDEKISLLNSLSNGD